VLDDTTAPSLVQGAKPEGNVSISSAFDKTMAKVRSANADRRPLDLADLRPCSDLADLAKTLGARSKTEVRSGVEQGRVGGFDLRR